MADIFDKMASEFIAEKRASKKASSQRVAALPQPLRLQPDYGESRPGSALPRSASTFEEFDTDNDGVLSPSEWQDAFGVLDADDDGFLSDTEWGNAAFSDLDTDDDGVISKADWDEGFDELDLDDDGLLDESEFNARSADQNDPHHFYTGSRWADDMMADQNDPRHFYMGDKAACGEIYDDIGLADDEFAFEKVDYDPAFEHMVRVARITSKKTDKKQSKSDFEEFKKNNSSFAEKWDENIEEYGNVVKNRAKATKSEDFQKADKEQAGLEKKVDALQKKKDKIVDEGGLTALGRMASWSRHGSGVGSYMSLQNIKQMHNYLDVLEGQVHAGEELDDWVEDKITEAKVHLGDVAAYFENGLGHHTHDEIIDDLDDEIIDDLDDEIIDDLD